MSLPCNKHPFYQQLEQQLDTTRTEGLYKTNALLLPHSKRISLLLMAAG